MGSSPLTRGKLQVELCLQVRRGLIPAHAGKTPSSAAPGDLIWAHPRSRGENSAPASAVLIAWGSSPLTRGKLECVPVAGDRAGLIPAHAGKTSSPSARAVGATAHPRSRGENVVASPSSRSGLGSSPLTRGKHFLTCAFTAQIGQILESLELCASSESYSSPDAYATDAP